MKSLWALFTSWIVLDEYEVLLLKWVFYRWCCAMLLILFWCSLHFKNTAMFAFVCAALYGCTDKSSSGSSLLCLTLHLCFKHFWHNWQHIPIACLHSNLWFCLYGCCLENCYYTLHLVNSGEVKLKSFAGVCGCCSKFKGMYRCGHK